MTREDIRGRIRSHPAAWDIIVAGGGATGVGVAIDAAARGYDVLLFEQSDFGKGTSSRSTKLVHGGVRYLEQGNLPLVTEALHERGLLLQNAPHLVRNLGFVVPRYDWWEAPFYGIGLKLYDLLAGRYGFGASKILSLEETRHYLPTLDPEGLRGGVIYFDGQFDDSRLLIHMVATAFEQGAILLNYAAVKALTKDTAGSVNGVIAADVETGEEFRAAAKVVINATGAFSDNLRRQSDPAPAPLIAPSQGIHLVFDRSFLPGPTAIMVPHTTDGRVMFAIPWHGHTLVGTTDTPIAQPVLEPVARQEEVDFLLATSARYLSKKPTRADVLSVFAGIRPLVGRGDGTEDNTKTAALARDHVVHIDNSRMVTICGGKWTTYRKMAEDCVNQAAMFARLDKRDSVTRNLKIHGFHSSSEQFGDLAVYGADALAILELAAENPTLARRMHPDLPYITAEVVWGVRFEMARTVEDVLARRTRALFLNSRAAEMMAPAVADIMARELGFGEVWKANQLAAFETLAANYRLH
jgi:glycerol-3-phosphate dehydrogenase